MDPQGSYATALIATILVEAAAAFLLVPAPGRGRVLGALLCANLVTHPIAWMLPVHDLGGWILLEAAVAVVEAALLLLATGLPVRRAALVAAAANGATALLALSPLRGLGFWS